MAVFTQTNFSCLKVRLSQWSTGREQNLQAVVCALLRLLSEVSMNLSKSHTLSVDA